MLEYVRHLLDADRILRRICNSRNWPRWRSTREARAPFSLNKTEFLQRRIPFESLSQFSPIHIRRTRNELISEIFPRISYDFLSRFGFRMTLQRFRVSATFRKRLESAASTRISDNLSMSNPKNAPRTEELSSPS